MAAQKKAVKQPCKNKSCKRVVYRTSSFCNPCYRKASIEGFLSLQYTQMKSRTKGGSTKRPDLYLGKSIVPREAFTSWARNSRVFLSLFKQWASNKHSRKLTPTVNRVDSSQGYELDNMEWITVSQNCALAGTQRRLNERKQIYAILGVNQK